MRRPERWLVLWCLLLAVIGGCSAGEPAEPRLAAGKALLAQGDGERAIVELTAAIAADPQLREAYVLRGDARLARQEAEPAIGDYAKALELAVDGQVYFKLGLANIQRGDYDQALTDFAKVLELATTISEQERTTIVDAYVERGKILMQQAAERGTQRYADYHFYESARADFSQALELDEKCLAAHRLRGDAFLATGQTHKALADYNAFIALAPQNAAGYRLRAAVHEADGKLAEARTDYDRAVALAPTDPQTFLGRGRLAREDLRLPDALADFAQAKALNPAQAAGYVESGETKLIADRFAEAAVDFDQALALEPENPQVHLTRGRARLRQAQQALAWEESGTPRLVDGANRLLLENAVDDLTKALKLERNTESAYRLRGEAYLLLGDQVRAEDDFHWALWQDRSDFAAYKARGDLAMLRKDFDKAIEDYTEAIDYSNNKFIEAFLARARAYQAKGEADKAARDRERAAALRAPAK